MMQRLQGSPDLFEAPARSVNFLTAHDGFTMFDLVAYDRKHNDANGWGGTDGTDDNRSWNCGWEGEHGAPDEVVELRRRQLRNAWTLLFLSHGDAEWRSPVTSSPAPSTGTTIRTTRTTRPRGRTGYDETTSGISRCSCSISPSSVRRCPC